MKDLIDNCIAVLRVQLERNNQPQMYFKSFIHCTVKLVLMLLHSQSDLILTYIL